MTHVWSQNKNIMYFVYTLHRTVYGRQQANDAPIFEMNDWILKLVMSEDSSS